jgi:predicted alpha/beta hydrolase family esterase
MMRFITLPGIGNSGPDHWQSRWEEKSADMVRFKPDSWDAPEVENWLDALDTVVRVVGPTGVMVAHSLSCLLVAHWSERSSLPIAGAFLVAVPDPSVPAFPAEAAGFAPAPAARLRFPSMLLASDNDPYASIAYARQRARLWGSALVEVGPLGHVNAASGIGDWPWGRNQLLGFIRHVAEGRATCDESERWDEKPNPGTKERA